MGFDLLLLSVCIVQQEVSVFLPLILFLMEWWFYKVSSIGSGVLKRYAAFLIVIVP